MTEDEQASKKCFRCQKSEPGEGGVLCPGCKAAIETYDQPCPDCGGPGELEWRRTPDVDHLAARVTTKLRWTDRPGPD
ncbi:hypothetical protein [Amycolatopsis sp. FDAARGOS 1241]|uniref:hypothetical protein n=1 Tax=Amycolatopsis sp. FDAARGOS 1241 TaxID=2778070 RepID=UPI001951D258|nr:hypothetical protein [Amycolatopsis sp. FDAARGOS 1241]QRP49036.1 hypothetical protein I6J71_15285 [Amycolatopsis sp. FDAARGOS 1241]